MIDYLELLLVRQEQEEPGETLEWEQMVSAVQRWTADRDGADPQFRAGNEPISGDRAGNEPILGVRVRNDPIPGSRAGEQPDFLTRALAESAAQMAGMTAPSPGVSGLWTGLNTISGGMGDPETAGFDIDEAAGAGAGLMQAETGSAVSLFQAREAALTGGADSTALSGAPGLYRQMARTGQAVGGLRYSTRLLTVAEGTSASPGLGAEELDELFSRDARRYDGGFSLY